MDVLAIFNPNASRVNDRAQTAVMRTLAPRCTVEAVRTDHPFHAAELARRAAAEGARLVIAVGGDGTANEAANGLVGAETALWCLPAGSTNVFARTLGAHPKLATATEQLAAVIDHPQVRPMSTGTVAGRHFLFMSGIGVTAHIMKIAAEHQEMRARMGAGYVALGVAAAVSDVARGRLPKVLVSAGGETAEAGTVIVQRSDPLTFFGRRPVSVCPPAALGDGTLSVAMADRAGPRDVAEIFGRLLGGDPEKVIAHPRVHAKERLPSLIVSSADGRPFGIEVDGTYMGDAVRAEYGVAPDSLRVATA